MASLAPVAFPAECFEELESCLDAIHEIGNGRAEWRTQMLAASSSAYALVRKVESAGQDAFPPGALRDVTHAHLLLEAGQKLAARIHLSSIRAAWLEYWQFARK